MMTDIDRNKLYEALQTIQGVCMKHRCYECPMLATTAVADPSGIVLNKNDCALVKETPNYWVLPNPSDWRAIL